MRQFPGKHYNFVLVINKLSGNIPTEYYPIIIWVSQPNQHLLNYWSKMCRIKGKESLPSLCLVFGSATSFQVFQVHSDQWLHYYTAVGVAEFNLSTRCQDLLPNTKYQVPSTNYQVPNTKYKYTSFQVFTELWSMTTLLHCCLSELKFQWAAAH